MDIVEKCARALCAHDGDHDPFPTEGYWHKHYMNAALAVIDALADGVSQEMMEAAAKTLLVDPSRLSPGGVDELRRAIAAAIRAAKSRDDTPPPPKD